MNKIFFFILALPFVMSSCFLLENNDVKELQEQVAQLQMDVAELQKANGKISAKAILTIQ